MQPDAGVLGGLDALFCQGASARRAARGSPCNPNRNSVSARLPGCGDRGVAAGPTDPCPCQPGRGPALSLIAAGIGVAALANQIWARGRYRGRIAVTGASSSAGQAVA